VHTIRTVLLIVVAVLALGTTDVFAGGFLKIEGIEGESKDENHDKWIDVLSIDWGMERVEGRFGASRNSWRLEFNDLTVMKAADSATPSLMLKCAKGESVPEVIVDLPLSSDSGEANIRVILYNAVITSVHIGETDAAERPSEHISINFTEVKVIYEGLGRTVEFGWDLRRGRAL